RENLEDPAGDPARRDEPRRRVPSRLPSGRNRTHPAEARPHIRGAERAPGAGRGPPGEGRTGGDSLLAPLRRETGAGKLGFVGPRRLGVRVRGPERTVALTPREIAAVRECIENAL